MEINYDNCFDCRPAAGGGARLNAGYKNLMAEELLTLKIFPRKLSTMAASTYQEIKNSLLQLYLEDGRPWLVGFSGGKDSTLVAALVFDTVMAIPPERRVKHVTILCTDHETNRPRELQEEIAAGKKYPRRHLAPSAGQGR